MSTNMITFKQASPLLRAAGYAATPCSLETGIPIGPVAQRQFEPHKFPENDNLPVSVLTWVPAPKSELEPYPDPTSVRLATVTVRVRAELTADVEALIKRHVGKSRCPVLVREDGSLVYVFKAREVFRAATGYSYEPDIVVAEVAASWLPLEGNWRAGIDLLSVTRSELPELDDTGAKKLIGQIEVLFDKHAPPITALPSRVFTPKALLTDAGALRYGMKRELARLRSNNYTPCPVVPKGKGVIRPRLTPEESQQYEGYPTDREEWKDAHVGLLTGWKKPNVNFDRTYVRHGASHLAEIRVRIANADLMAAVEAVLTARLGIGPVRIAPDGERLYLFQRERGAPCEPVDFNRRAGQLGFPAIPGTQVIITIAKDDTILVSGYQWENGNPLTVSHDDLPRLDTQAANGLIRAVEGLLQSFTVRKAS